jgi:hypothetical protein
MPRTKPLTDEPPSGLREKLNKNPWLAAVLAVVCLGILAAVTFWPKGDDDNWVPYTGKRFFTVDDGQSYFVADGINIPPFTHEGKTAFRVQVYTCEDGKPTVAFLERYNEAALSRIRKMDGGTIKLPEKALEYLDQSGAREVKKPGETQWVRRGMPRYAEITMPTCPDGGPVKWVNAK